jgi:hypothetical protein
MVILQKVKTYMVTWSEGCIGMPETQLNCIGIPIYPLTR